MKKISYFLINFLLIIFLGQAWAASGDLTSHGFLYKPPLGAKGSIEKNNFDAGLDRLDTRLGKEIWVGDPNYGTTFQTGVTAIGSSNVILCVPAGTHNITADLTVPANITLRVERGAVFAIATTKTLTINGGLEAGLYQIFSCTGTGRVSFAANKAIKSVTPYWWGATFDGSTLDTTALQAAMNTGITVEFPFGKTAKTRKLTLPVSGLRIEGNNSTLDQDLNDSGSTGIMESAVAVSNLTIRNLNFYPRHSLDAVNYRSGIIVWNGGASDVLLENCYFQDAFLGFSVQENQAWGTPLNPATRITIRNCRMIGPNFMPDGQQRVASDFLTYGNLLADLGAKATNCLIEGNYVENIGGVCIFNARPTGVFGDYQGWSECAYNKVINNTSVNGINDGIYVFGVGNLISGNHIYRTGATAIVINNDTNPDTGLETSRDNIITGNFVQSAGRNDGAHSQCIVAWGKNNQVEGNKVVLENPATFPNPFMGAFGLNGEGAVLSGNSVSSKDGLVAGDHLTFVSLGKGSVNIVGNTIQNVFKILELGNTMDIDRVNFSNNLVRDFNYGIMVSGTTRAKYWTVNNNTFSGFINNALNLNGDIAYPVPIHWTVNGNQFIGNGATARGISLTRAGRLTVNNNSFSGLRAYDAVMDEPDAVGPIFGEGNSSDGLATNASTAYTVKNHAKRYPSTGPTVGSWRADEIAWIRDAASGAKIGNLCTVSGTLGTLSGVTGTITTGTATLTVNTAAGLYPGCYITIAGVTGAKKVTAVSGTAVTIDSNADATVNGAAVAYSAPTFKTWGVIS